MSEETIPVDAVYVGRRLSTKGALAHFWLFPDGKEKGWKKNIALARIGETWCLQMTPDHKSVILKPSPVKVSLLLADQTAEWVATDAAHYQHHKAQQAERRFKEQASQFEEAMRPIRALVAATRHHDDRAALIQRITSELWRR